MYLKKIVFLLFSIFLLSPISAFSAPFLMGSLTPPSVYAIIPFVLLLILIAVGPIFFEKLWHKSYGMVSVVFAVFIIIYYVFFLHNYTSPIHSFFEYFQFIALISSLFIVSGTIVVKVDKPGTPIVNVILLFIGAILANFISTTGASMLLIRPFINLNKGRIKVYHIVFFIFIVSNVGGCLTPIGDPPLFLGFLKGVPFFWTLKYTYLVWCFALFFLLLFFYLIDMRNKKSTNTSVEDNKKYSGKIQIIGKTNFIWITIIIASVFIDPAKIHFLPAIFVSHDGDFFISSISHFNANVIALNYTEEYSSQFAVFSFIRELIMFSCAILSFKLSRIEVRKINEFSFEPIREVGFLFVGIFFTMMPALELISIASNQPHMQELITQNSVFWITGTMSSLLDNAPTYINFFTACISSQGGNVHLLSDVLDFCNETGKFSNTVELLRAISVSSVFFGAMTYIGNGPNFMVKAIAEQRGIDMPSFFSYIFKYSIIYLLPVIFLSWLIFF